MSRKGVLSIDWRSLSMRHHELVEQEGGNGERLDVDAVLGEG